MRSGAQVVQRRVAHRLAEALGQRGARQPGAAGQLLQRPGVGAVARASAPRPGAPAGRRTAWLQPAASLPLRADDLAQHVGEDHVEQAVHDGVGTELPLGSISCVEQRRPSAPAGRAAAGSSARSTNQVGQLGEEGVQRRVPELVGAADHRAAAAASAAVLVAARCRDLGELTTRPAQRRLRAQHVVAAARHHGDVARPAAPAARPASARGCTGPCVTTCSPMLCRRGSAARAPAPRRRRSSSRRRRPACWRRSVSRSMAMSKVYDSDDWT